MKGGEKREIKTKKKRYQAYIFTKGSVYTRKEKKILPPHTV